MWIIGNSGGSIDGAKVYSQKLFIFSQIHKLNIFWVYEAAKKIVGGVLKNILCTPTICIAV